MRKKKFSDIVAIFPLIFTLPYIFCIKPIIMLRKAVLPCPFRPIKENLYPGDTLISKLVLTKKSNTVPGYAEEVSFSIFRNPTPISLVTKDKLAF